MCDVLLSPSRVAIACICVGSKHFVCKPVLLLVYITSQINMLPKLRQTFRAVLVQGFNLTVLIKVIEHQVLLWVLSFFVITVIALAFACPSSCEPGYLLAAVNHLRRLLLLLLNNLCLLFSVVVRYFNIASLALCKDS